MSPKKHVHVRTVFLVVVVPRTTYFSRKISTTRFEHNYVAMNNSDSHMKIPQKNPGRRSSSAKITRFKKHKNNKKSDIT